MRVLLMTLTVGLVFSAAPCLHADDDEAKAAFEEGKRHFHAEEFEEAADAFRKAHELKPNWKLLFNIGQSEAAAKRFGLALEAFETYLAQGGDEVQVDRRDEVLSEIKQFRDMTGFLELEGRVGKTYARLLGIDGEG